MLDEQERDETIVRLDKENARLRSQLAGLRNFTESMAITFRNY